MLHPMLRMGFCAVCVAVLSLTAEAAPTTSQQAEKVVGRWLTAGTSHLGARLSNQVVSVQTYADAQGKALYHVVALQPSGFVIVAGDDQVEPIIAFAATGAYDDVSDNPLRALVTADVPQRVAAVRSQAAAPAVGASKSPLHAGNVQSKWRTLSGASLEAATDSPPGVLDDPRVMPLLDSQWDQSTTSDGQYCYNYYTPNHYVCGCGATALAQFLRYYRHPEGGVGLHQFWILVDGGMQIPWLRGGDGLGGPYQWDLMVGVPNKGATDLQRQAIGALCSDAGVALNAQYTLNATWTAWGKEDRALLGTFGYSNAVYSGEYPYLWEISAILNANLDAGYPVLMGVMNGNDDAGHAVVCDGYGFNNNVMYHHVNLGWAGNCDAWYNIPDFSAAFYHFNEVTYWVYNVFPQGTGEIVSGRVTTGAREPIVGATITAVAADGATYVTASKQGGVYALAKIPSATQYTVTVTHPSYTFVSSHTVTTGTSARSSQSGNVWGIDFIASGSSAPMAKDINAMMRNGTASQIGLIGLDDGLPNPPAALTYIITSLPSSGTLSDPAAGAIASVPYVLVNGGNVVSYSAPPGEGGVATFTYVVNDGGTAPDAGDSNTATVTIRRVWIPSGVLFVDKRATGTGDGLAWQNACPNLQDALALAGTAGGAVEIRVAQGVYRPDEGADAVPGDRYQSFHLLSAIALKGGYAGVGAANPEARDATAWASVLSGDLAGNDGPGFSNYDDNSYHVVAASNCDTSAILDGFTIRGGNADVNNGGGVLVSAGSPLISNCRMEGSKANYGGAIYSDSSSATISRCTFTSNTAVTGGAAYSYCSTTSWINCTFRGNTSTAQGGAIYAYSSPAPSFVSCSFVQNAAGGKGGAIRNNACNSAVVNCLFDRNTATAGGGAINNYISSPTFINCTFFGNSTAATGGGMYGDTSGMATVTNCIFWGNTQQAAGSVANAQIFLNGVSANVSYSCIQDDVPGDNDVAFGGAASGNIDLDPLFVSTLYGNLRLGSGSPCINASDPAFTPTPGETDLDGESRKIGARVDIGAYEYSPAGDISGDGTVNVTDLLALVTAWASQANPPSTNWNAAADLNGDGYVNVGDLQILIANWGRSL